MSYAVKEIYYTLQGEGANVGRPAVFCRFAGCNLWSGREADRDSAICRFCDTEFVGTDGPGGGRFETPAAAADAVAAAWPDGPPDGRFVVCTGGEPLLQLDEALIEALHARDFTVAVETNGTLPAPKGLDWICTCCLLKEGVYHGRFENVPKPSRLSSPGPAPRYLPPEI